MSEFEKEFEEEFNNCLHFGYIPNEQQNKIIEHFKDWQPPKPLVVVPQFVAEWIEYCKSNKLTFLGAFDPVSEHGIGLANTFTGEVWKGIDWAKRNQETFARAWMDGYGVEKEKAERVNGKQESKIIGGN